MLSYQSKMELPNLQKQETNEKLNIPLTPEAKTLIIDKVYSAITLTYDEARNSNECDCGQPSCKYCN